jgi:hypothetical protein
MGTALDPLRGYYRVGEDDMAVVVRKKSDSKVLKISTPKARRHRWMATAGIVVPENIPLDDERVPLDFTRLSSRGIGELQSRYAVRHSHAVYNCALLEADILQLKREHRIAMAKFRIRNPGKAKNLVDALAEEDDEISDLLDAIAVVEIKLVLLEAVTKTYEGIRNAASREISRQISERAPID